MLGKCKPPRIVEFRMGATSRLCGSPEASFVVSTRLSLRVEEPMEELLSVARCAVGGWVGVLLLKLLLTGIDGLNC